MEICNRKALDEILTSTETLVVKYHKLVELHHDLKDSDDEDAVEVLLHLEAVDRLAMSRITDTFAPMSRKAYLMET